MVLLTFRGFLPSVKPFCKQLIDKPMLCLLVMLNPVRLKTDHHTVGLTPIVSGSLLFLLYICMYVCIWSPYPCNLYVYIYTCICVCAYIYIFLPFGVCGI